MSISDQLDTYMLFDTFILRLKMRNFKNKLFFVRNVDKHFYRLKHLLKQV